MQENSNTENTKRTAAAKNVNNNQNSILIDPVTLNEQHNTSSSYSETSPLFRQTSSLFSYDIQIPGNETINVFLKKSDLN